MQALTRTERVRPALDDKRSIETHASHLREKKSSRNESSEPMRDEIYAR